MQTAIQRGKEHQQTSLVASYLCSRICAASCCGECSRKKINNERVCDFCFLKQYLKKQSHERKEMLKAREQTIEKLTMETKENEAKIDKLDIEIAKLEQSNITLEMEQSKSVREL